MACAGVLAGPGQALIVDEQDLAVSLTDYRDTGIIAWHKGKMLSENSFGRQVFQNTPGSVVFIADDGGLTVQQNSYDFAGSVKGVDLFSGKKAAFLRFHAAQHPLAVLFADVLK